VREIGAGLAAWDRAGLRYAVVTVIMVSGSAPRPPGSVMAVAENGAVLGSVSGGCIEGAVYELCREVIAVGKPVRERFGYSDGIGLQAGLTCGGVIEVLVQAQPPPEVVRAVSGTHPVALAHLLDGSGAVLAVEQDRHHGSTGSPELDARVTADVRALLAAGSGGIRSVGCRPEVEVFVSSWTTRPRLLVFGAIDHAAAVASLGAFLGYRVTVCDARPVFATSARFPEADEVVVDWPHRYLTTTEVDARTVIVALTHDAKFDVPLLEVALRLPVAYVGAMGSRRTHEERLARLREAGLTERELARLRSPIGLDLGARTPEETAVSIAAEIIAFRHGGGGHPLRETEGPLHRVSAKF
jgi:xanthine dehydrogenase accessory factor